MNKATVNLGTKSCAYFKIVARIGACIIIWILEMIAHCAALWMMISTVIILIEQ